MKKKLPALLLFCSAVCTSAFAQLIVTPAGNPANIAQFLTGNGVTISNVQVNCDSNAYGYFTASNTNMNMPGGMAITTGHRNSLAGPNSSSSTSTANGYVLSDADLAAIEPMAVYDVCALEFDCVPSDDTLYFNFIFGSEEYPEFAGASFNDVFGIFISGANPAGGNYTAMNFALIPNGTTPVSINNINNGPSLSGPCMNCAYYIDNTGDTLLEYDGITSNLLATVPVVPNNSYHLKIAIADAGDAIYDSGVFLQAGSFRVINTPVSVNPATLEQMVSLFPVPARNELTVTLTQSLREPLSFALLNQLGQPVLHTEIGSGGTQATIDVSSLSRGVYFAEICSASGKTVRKIVLN